MKILGLKKCLMLLAGSLFLIGKDLGATTTFLGSDADVFLNCEGHWLCYSAKYSMGDFDGDEHADVLITNYVYGYLVFGRSFPRSGSMNSFFGTNIGTLGTPYPPPQVTIGDITGDGKDEVFQSVGNRCAISFGRSNPGENILPPADLTIDSSPDDTIGYSFAFGDVNGDGIKDFLVYGGEAYVVFGSTSFETVPSTISVLDSNHVMRIMGGGAVGAGSIASGDVDGDGYDDILLGDSDRVVGTRGPAGAVYVIRGSSSPPSLWDLGSRAADWTILGTDIAHLDVVFAADFTGDGKDELGLKTKDGPIMLSGAGIIAHGPTIDLAPGYINSLSPTIISDGLGRYSQWIAPSDFDGDGRPDLAFFQDFLTILPPTRITLILSHSIPAGPSLPSQFPDPNFVFNDASQLQVMGDLNGDGMGDLIYGSRSFFRTYVFYGFFPLENPRLVVQPRQSNQARVHLTLNVEGEPAEMKLTGNILDPAPGVWIPFQSKVDVTVTPEEGEKTITAVFRTSGKRESDSVSAAVPLALGEAGSSVVTNLLREGGTARFEARLDTAGRLKASVYSREGRLLRTLIDEDMSAGVHVIEWDGTNGDGDRVAPGIYTVVVDRAGSIDRRRVLVK